MRVQNMGQNYKTPGRSMLYILVGLILHSCASPDVAWNMDFTAAASSSAKVFC